MKREEEEVWRPYHRTIGYCNRGPLYSRPPAPYQGTAICNTGELGKRSKPPSGRTSRKQPEN
jgi:hypothetical protein